VEAAASFAGVAGARPSWWPSTARDGVGRSRGRPCRNRPARKSQSAHIRSLGPPLLVRIHHGECTRMRPRWSALGRDGARWGAGALLRYRTLENPKCGKRRPIPGLTRIVLPSSVGRLPARGAVATVAAVWPVRCRCGACIPNQALMHFLPSWSYWCGQGSDTAVIASRHRSPEPFARGRSPKAQVQALGAVRVVSPCRNVRLTGACRSPNSYFMDVKCPGW
jgi:hypothetical protein